MASPESLLTSRRSDGGTTLKTLEAQNKSDSMRIALGLIKQHVPELMHRNLSGYQDLYEQYLSEAELKINWEKCCPPPAGMIVTHDDLEGDSWNNEAANKLAVLKLNGGLGTSMGCQGPKSAITVRDGMTFLDLAVKQVEDLNEKCGSTVPLVLMNSFNTHADTDLILRKYDGRPTQILRFNQSQMPRIWKDISQPVPKDDKDKEQWYPPGHGDLYRSLYNSGLLDKLLADGKEYLFISNIDNLGAVVDQKILSYFHENPECEFIMEVTDKTRADVKGGTLIDYEGQLRLLELAQVPKRYVDEFKSITKFRIFNTNNLWIKLSAIKRILTAGTMHMEIIENKKSINGTAVIQLEQAVGSAIKNFKNARGVNVPRSRFLPVKQSQDLLLVKSDLFYAHAGRLMLNEARVFNTMPLIKLGTEFKKVDHFLSRFETIPHIVELDHLTVSGDVYFGRDVVLKGTVIIIAYEGHRIDIPPCSLLENKIVTGDFRILEH